MDAATQVTLRAVMTDNPYKSPQPSEDHSNSLLGLRRKIGTGVLIAGLATLLYGAISFWIIPFLPPNEPATGRLNSLYVLGSGAIVSLLGLAVRETRIKSRDANNSEGNGISTGRGLLILLVVTVLFIVAIATMT